MPRQILIVDDDRDLSRMLRATLELFDRTYKVVEVPSAEEALLEVRRSRFDLIVADVHLPGMDGFDLLRRVRRAYPELQGILISGNPDPSYPVQAKALEYTSFFRKPLNTDEFILAVQRALGDVGKPMPRQQEVAAYVPTLADRLSALRRDLGCLAVYVADLDGQIVARAGDVSSFDIEQLIRHIEVAFSASLNVCHMLGGVVAQNMHFFDGDEYDVYVLNVGQSYMLVMLYSGELGARQLGQVSRYGRQAADDLLNHLAERAVPATVFEPARPEPVSVMPPTIEFVSPELSESIILEPGADFMIKPQPEPEPVEALNIQFETLDAAAGGLTNAELDSFWDAPQAESETANTSGNALSLEQAIKLGLVPKDE